jgi:hypothetical protein
MGPMNDDEKMVTRPAAEVPVKSGSPADAAAVAERAGKEADVEDRGEPGIPGMEEAGYGYGV